MNKQPYVQSREKIVADAIQGVVRELRLVDVADYIAFIRMERLGCLADIVESAAELYFMPGALRLGHGGEAEVDWTGEPRIVLDLELRPHGAIVYFSLALSDLHASVEVNYISFEKPLSEPESNTAFLASVIEDARIRRPEEMLRFG